MKIFQGPEPILFGDEFYLSLAIAQAWKYQGLTFPNPAVGACIVREYGQILSVEAHKEKGFAHAELNAVITAFVNLGGNKEILELKNPNHSYEYLLKNHNNLFKNCSIYVTLEPCLHFGSTPPCSILIQKLGFKKVVIGTFDKDKIASGGYEFLLQKKIDVKIGVLQKECEELLEPFLKWNSGENFIFFKFAMTQNGVYDGGIISSVESRTLVHKMRSKIDLLVIGGNTVRLDRPILDARMCENGKAPDVLIYSKSKNFDTNIPLFLLKNRNIFIENSLERISEYKNIMIEGGEGMFEATRGIVDWYLFFISENFKKGRNINIDLNLKTLCDYHLSSDLIRWAKAK